MDYSERITMSGHYFAFVHYTDKLMFYLCECCGASIVLFPPPPDDEGDEIEDDLIDDGSIADG